jgi:hypothetical protein
LAQFRALIEHLTVQSRTPLSRDVVCNMKKANLTYQCPINLNDLSSNYYCNNCNKNLTDFRQKKEFKLASDTCGIFTSNQIGKIKRKGQFAILGLAIPLLTVLSVSMPNTGYSQEKTAIEITNNELNIRGAIKDKSTNELLPFINIRVAKGNKQIFDGFSNENGEFTINIDSSKYDIKDLKIIFSLVGYKSDTTNLIEDNNEIVIEFATDNTVLLNPSHIVLGMIDSDTEWVYINGKKDGHSPTFLQRVNIFRRIKRNRMLKRR